MCENRLDGEWSYVFHALLKFQTDENLWNGNGKTDELHSIYLQIPIG